MDIRECVLTQPELLESAEVTTVNLLPEKSRQLYQHTYKAFCEWKNQKKTDETSQPVVLLYFKELAEKYNCATLWQKYSILKSTLKIYEDVDITKYPKLLAYVKQQNQGYIPRKAKAFTRENITGFLKNAPDSKYLATKVVLILGVMGACHSSDLYNMKMHDVQDLNSCYVIKVQKNKKFIISDPFYNIVKKYVLIRNQIVSEEFFLNYKNSKCTKQRIGINKFTKMGRDIANFLKLPDPEMYTGHSFHRTSRSLLIDPVTSLTGLMPHGQWTEDLASKSAKNFPEETKRKFISIAPKKSETPTPPPSPSAGNGETNESQDIPEDNNEDESFERGEEEVDFNDLNNDTVVIDPTTSADGSLFNPNQFPTELECDLFGEYVSKHLQELPLEVSLHLQYEIQHLVMMTRLHYNSHYANQTSTTIKEEVEDEAEIPPEEEPIAESDENPSTNEELYIDPEPPEAKRRKLDSNPDSKPSAPQPEQTKRTSCTVFAEHIAVQLEQLPDELAQHLQTNIYAMISEVLPQFYKDDPPGNVPVKTEAVDVSQTEILHDYELD